MNQASYVVWDSTCVSQGQLLFVFTSIGILFYYLRWESWQLLVISASGTLDLVNLHKVGGPDWLLEVSLGIAVALANQSSKTTRSSRKKTTLPLSNCQLGRLLLLCVLGIHRFRPVSPGLWPKLLCLCGIGVEPFWDLGPLRWRADRSWKKEPCIIGLTPSSPLSTKRRQEDKAQREHILTKHWSYLYPETMYKS